MKLSTALSGALAAAVIVAAAVAGTASASPTPSQIKVLGSTQSTIEVEIPYTEQVQFYTDGSPVQVEREVLAAGTYALKGNRIGLKPGEGYFVRAAGNTGWTLPVFISTLAASGANGSAGSAGTALVSETALAPATVTTGGSFATNAISLGTVKVPNGQYEVIVAAKVATDAKSEATEFPVVTVYDGTPKVDFSNDLFNLGEGQLPTSNSIDQYINGSQVVKVTSGELDIKGFGYSTDKGAGEYSFEGGTVTILSVS